MVYENFTLFLLVHQMIKVLLLNFRQTPVIVHFALTCLVILVSVKCFGAELKLHLVCLELPMSRAFTYFIVVFADRSL